MTENEEKSHGEIEGIQLMVVPAIMASTGPNVPEIFKFWFTTSIAYILLFIYVGAVIYMVMEPSLGGVKITDSSSAAGVTSIETVAVMIGGLISALVISISAVTPTNISMFTNRDKAQLIAMMLYIAVWIVVGVLALVKGIFMQGTGTYDTTISGIGTTWLATAVATGYAYFNLGEPDSG